MSVGATMHPDDEEVLAGLDFSDIEAKHAVHFNSPLDSTILIDGVPLVAGDRIKKLYTVLEKRFREKGFRVSSATDFDMPLGSEGEDGGQSKGYLFATLSDPDTARSAAAAFDGFAFDKRHTFSAWTFSDIERLQSPDAPSSFAEPERKPHKPAGHLRSWLADEAGRDQLLVLRHDELSIGWLSRNGSVDVVESRTKWTESYGQWSPRGLCLATMHLQGVALWGGPGFERLVRLSHPQVRFIDFSPEETYVITWSPIAIELPRDGAKNPNIPFTPEDEGNHIAVWDRASGKLLRTFPMVMPVVPESAILPAIPDELPSAGNPEPVKLTIEQKRVKARKMLEEVAGKKTFVWPIFKWSGDEKYLARVTQGASISIYEAPSMGLLDKKSVKIEGVMDFEWRPLGEQEREQAEAPEGSAMYKKALDHENILAYWVVELQNQPARCNLMSVPSRKIERSRNLVNVHDAKLFWQSNGDYLCVKVDRHTRSGKTTYCNLELFRLRDRNMPVEAIEIKDTVTAFAWEPNGGNRFALITSNDPALAAPGPGQTLKTSQSFYQYDPRKSNFIKLRTFDGKASTHIFWSPRGRHMVFAVLGSSQKFDLEFYDLDLESAAVVGQKGAGGAAAADPAAAIHLLKTVDHYGMTAVEWDPSGRYLVAAGSSWQSSMEPGYAIYDFRGNEIVRQQLDKLMQVVWRPRPRPLLSRDDVKRIRRNLRDYSRAFEEQDALEATNVSAELLAHRRRLVDEWNAFRRQATEELERNRKAADKPVPRALANAIGLAKATETVQEEIEEVLEETVEVLG